MYTDTRLRHTQFGLGCGKVDAKARQLKKRKAKHRKKIKAGRKRRLANLRKRG